MSDHPILIVDLEATCWDSSTSETQPQTLQSMEIIEIGCALATRQGAVLDARSFLVRPVRQPQLSDFCTQLTHITQSMVDGAPPLADAIAQMNVWLNNIGDDFIWGSWGNYDLHHLTTQCAIDGANSALLKHDHLNLKKLWRRTTRQRKRTSLAAALDFHDIEFAGQPHRGIDDAQNIARILPFMDWSLEAEIITTRETSMHMQPRAGLAAELCRALQNTWISALCLAPDGFQSDKALKTHIRFRLLTQQINKLLEAVRVQTKTHLIKHDGLLAFAHSFQFEVASFFTRQVNCVVNRGTLL